MSHHLNWYRTNSKIFLKRFATYQNIAITPYSTPNMETEQPPPQQSPPIVANMHDEGLQPHAQSYDFTTQPHHH